MNRTEYKNQHAKDHYDRINLAISKGEWERVRAADLKYFCRCSISDE